MTASMQRSPTYCDTVAETRKKKFRASLRCELEKIASRFYRNHEKVNDDRHEQNICELAKTITACHRDILHRGQFRIGSAQKCLNLYLKYLWCVGEIAEPPHCPFDNLVVDKLGSEFAECRWTKLDDIQKYKDMVAAARTMAGKESLAKWELELWNRRNNPPKPSRWVRLTTGTLTVCGVQMA
jgi:hypothetical protein